MESDLPGRTENPAGFWALQDWADDPWSLHLLDFAESVRMLWLGLMHSVMFIISSSARKNMEMEMEYLAATVYTCAYLSSSGRGLQAGHHFRPTGNVCKKDHMFILLENRATSSLVNNSEHHDSEMIIWSCLA